MTNFIYIPSALVLGCNTPHGIGVLSDYIEEQTGHAPNFHECGWSNEDYRRGSWHFDNPFGYSCGLYDSNGCGRGENYGIDNGDGWGGGYGYINGGYEFTGTGDGFDIGCKYHYGNNHGNSVQ